jgi:hypothetical protein
VLYQPLQSIRLFKKEKLHLYLYESVKEKSVMSVIGTNMLAVVGIVDLTRIAADDLYERHFASGSSSSSRFAYNVRMAPSCINGYQRKMS